MANPDYRDDQAGSLRRLMAGPQPRVISVLSATDGLDKSRLMTNLAVSLKSLGNDVLLINANSRQISEVYGTRSLNPLAAVAAGQTALATALRRVDQGYSIASLMTARQLHDGLAPQLSAALDQLLLALAHERDVLLLDAELTEQSMLPLPAMNGGDIMIHLNQQPSVIKQAYRLIKRAYSQLGCRAFSVLMTDVQPAEAQGIFNNLAQVARRYLAVRLELAGVIPADEYLHRAGKLGRSVIEAFPATRAATAFQDLAKRLSESGTACMMQP